MTRRDRSLWPWLTVTSGVAFASGCLALTIGSGRAGVVLFAHGALGFAVVVWLVLHHHHQHHRHRSASRSRLIDVAATGAASAVVATGVLHTSGSWIGRGEYAALSVHVALAVATAALGVVLAPRWMYRRWRRGPRARLGNPPLSLEPAQMPEAELHRRRVIGAVARIKTGGVETALRQLVKARTITKAHVDAWRAVRHPTAHGEEIGATFRELIDNCDLAHQLLVLLMLRAIGYSGFYTDWLKPRHPLVNLAEENPRADAEERVGNPNARDHGV